MRHIFVLLRDARYYGPFRNAINQGAGEHFDLRIGTSFIDLWNEWKTSGIKAKLRAIDQITEEIRTLFEFARLEINASIQLKTLLVSIDGQSYRLGELGSGLSQFIMVLGNAATTNPSLLLIDEPETNLHPALQVDFLLAVAHYAQLGCVLEPFDRLRDSPNGWTKSESWKIARQMSLDDITSTDLGAFIMRL